MAITVFAKKWGNSIGIIIPNAIVEKEGIKPEQPVNIEIKTMKNPLKELFGTLKFNEPTEKILKGLRRKESKYL